MPNSGQAGKAHPAAGPGKFAQMARDVPKAAAGREERAVRPLPRPAGLDEMTGSYPPAGDAAGDEQPTDPRPGPPADARPPGGPSRATPGEAVPWTNPARPRTVPLGTPC